MKDTVTTFNPDPELPADTDATTGRSPDTEDPDNHTEVSGEDAIDDLSAATTEHLRRLWMAGARDITVTYDADVVRHRTYLAHPRTDT